MKASSICALSCPTCAHCALKRSPERLPIFAVMNIEIGTVTSATSAKSGEMTSITVRMPSTVNSAFKL